MTPYAQMMGGDGSQTKPRIVMFKGRWYCFTKQITSWLGMGDSAREAYMAWEKKQ